MNRVPLRVIGADLRPSGQGPSVAPDVPRGIEYLDIEWFAGRVTLESIKACETDEQLRALRRDAEWVLRLAALKAKATGQVQMLGPLASGAVAGDAPEPAVVPPLSWWRRWFGGG